MKRNLSILLILALVLNLLPAVGRAEGGTMTVAATLPQAVFAKGEIETAAAKCGIAGDWTVSLERIDEALGYEAYRIEVEGHAVTVTGGDANGLMYGGLEVAEQIAFANGMEGVHAAEGKPYVLNRGIKFNIPLDMRTPSYTDAGDAAQLNIENMWDMDFWTEYIDELARNRFNALSIWNLNPFPSMVKLADYPDVALDDVWRTTLPLDGSYNGTATDMVRPEHWENYEVVKTITIDGKIDFWRGVMAYAHSRGVKFYVFTWNIYTYGEQGKYGITDDAANEVTRDYFRRSVQAMVETYPDLDGIGFSAGENMDWSMEQNSNEEWLYDTYGLGVNAALEKEPDRDFTLIHRWHLVGDFDTLMQEWSGFRGSLEFSDKYSFAHMHSSTTPHFADESLNLLPENTREWLEVRWDDMYYARWGDADFIRDYITHMPDESKLRGFFFGADGYIFGRDYTSLDEEEYGQQHIRKHWYEYALLGRLGYSPNRGNDAFRALMAEHFEDAVSREKTDLLFDAMNAAGKIVPQVARFYWINTDAYYPEMCLTHKTAFKFLTVKTWANTKNNLEGGGVMNIPDWAEAVAAGQESFGLQTPIQAAEALNGYAIDAMACVDVLLADEPAAYASPAEREFYAMVKDQRMQAEMGCYYSEKLYGAAEIGLYNATGEKEHQDRSVSHLEKALAYWQVYADDFAARYRPQMMARLQLTVNPADYAKDAERDISLAQKWRIR